MKKQVAPSERSQCWTDDNGPGRLQGLHKNGSEAVLTQQGLIYVIWTIVNRLRGPYRTPPIAHAVTGKIDVRDVVEAS